MTGPSTDQLSLQFDLQDTPAGVALSTLQVLAGELNMSETQVVLLALARLANEKMPEYSPDDGPLTTAEILAIQSDTDAHMPKGRVLQRMSLLALPSR